MSPVTCLTSDYYLHKSYSADRHGEFGSYVHSLSESPVGLFGRRVGDLVTKGSAVFSGCMHPAHAKERLDYPEVVLVVGTTSSYLEGR